MKFKSILCKIAGIICSFAFITAISSLDNMCIATYNQPVVPKSLDKYRKH